MPSPQIEKKVKEIMAIFKLYPTIFPSGYFRFLKKDLTDTIERGTYVYREGVFLSWKVYTRDTPYFRKGDVKIIQLVNKHKGNGKARKIFTDFLKTHGHNDLYLFVLQSNKHAIKFYRRNGFRKTETIDDRIIMKRKGK